VDFEKYYHNKEAGLVIHDLMKTRPGLFLPLLSNLM